MKDSPGKDWTRREERAYECGGSTAERSQKRQARPVGKRKGDWGGGEGDEWRRGCGHLSCARVSIASWRMELERESSGSSWICLWTGDNRETNDGVRLLQTTKAEAIPCLKKQAAVAPQPGQTGPTATPCWGRQLTAHSRPEHPEHPVQGHQKHPTP